MTSVSNKKSGFIIILAIVSIVLAIGLFWFTDMKFALFNLIRSVIFSCLSVYLIFNQDKINFFQSFNISQNALTDFDKKMSVGLSYVVGMLNFVITLIFFFEKKNFF